MNNCKGLLKDKNGNAVVLACVIVISLLLIFCTVSEYFRLQMIAKGVRDALETSIIGVATQNYAELYNGLREGYSGGYDLYADNWLGTLDEGDVFAQLDDTLGLEEDGAYHIKMTGSEVEYKLDDLNVNTINAPFAPANTDNTQRFEAVADITLEVPLSFGFDQLPPMKINMRVKAGYTPKF